MADAVTVTNGKAEMAYIGETPWHGLGEKLEKGATPAQMKVAGGMEWTVNRSPVKYNDDGVWEEQHVLYRSDTKAPLSVVSNKYEIVQPGQVVDFFDSLARDNGMQMETVGTLFGGRRYWALAKTGNQVSLAGKDVIGQYLLLATSCDGSMATTASFTSVRVVCNNTLQMALSGKKPAVKVRHNQVFSETQVKIDLGVAEAEWVAFKTAAESLSKIKIDRKTAARTMAKAIGDVELFDIKFEASSDPVLALDKQPNGKSIQRVLELFDGSGKGADLKSAKGTAWGLVNAWTQYQDWEIGGLQSNRLASAWWGIGASRKEAVLQAALELV